MNKIKLLSVFFISFLFFQSLFAEKIGLLSVATGKYNVFIPPLIESARKHFLKGHEVTFFVFADREIPKADDIVTTYQSRMGWPQDTLLRFDVYLKNKELFDSFDYLFACDADMLFGGEVTSDILGERVGTLHCGFVENCSDITSEQKTRFSYNENIGLFETRGTYDCNPQSKAYISDSEGEHYFAGGFWGGSKNEFLKACAQIMDNIKSDFSWDYIAVWHDESYLNRYFINNPPSVILPPSYCYPEHLEKSYGKQLIALLKDHKKFRSND